MQIDRLPPQAIEAEESILAYCLLNNPDEVVDSLCPDDFYRTTHKEIFDGVCKLHKFGTVVDLVSMSDYLRSAGELEKCGGAAYLSRLVNDCPISTSVSHHIKIIKDKSILRRLIAASSETMQECFDDAGNVEKVLDDAQKRIVGIDYGSDDCVVTAGEALDPVIEKMEERQSGGATGIRTGISKIDLLLGGLQPSDSIILGGRPSMGKTSLALNILRNVSVEDRIPSAIWSLEMAKDPLIQRWISMEARIDGGKFLNNSFNHSDWTRITDAAARISEAPIYIDDRSGLSYMEVRRTMRRLVKKHGIKLAVIDYMQLMSGDSKDGRTREIGSISRAIKGMAKEFCIPVIAICQLSRKCEERSDKRPLLSDLRESGEIEQDADVVMFVYRDEVYTEDLNNPNRGTAEILIRKHRNGAIGKVTMTFLKAYQRFEEYHDKDRYGDYAR